MNLRQNARSVLEITLQLAHPQGVHAALYDMRGAEVTSKVTPRLEAGLHTLKIDIGTIAYGYYLVRVRTGTQRMAGSIFLAR
jgi:hypothetical protein